MALIDQMNGILLSKIDQHLRCKDWALGGQWSAEPGEGASRLGDLILLPGLGKGGV